MQLYWKSNKSYLFPESNISHESGQKISIFPSFHFILLLFILRLFCLLQIASYFPKFAWHHYLNTNQLNICKRGKRFLENTFNDLIIFRTLNGSNKELTIDVQIKKRNKPKIIKTICSSYVCVTDIWQQRQLVIEI